MSPFFGPLFDRVKTNRQLAPDSAQTPQRGSCPSQRSLRFRHSSHASLHRLRSDHSPGEMAWCECMFSCGGSWYFSAIKVKSSAKWTSIFLWHWTKSIGRRRKIWGRHVFWVVCGVGEPDHIFDWAIRRISIDKISLVIDLCLMWPIIKHSTESVGNMPLELSHVMTTSNVLTLHDQWRWFYFHPADGSKNWTQNPQ